MDGLEQGYGGRTSGDSSMHIPSADIFWMNIFGDLEDLEQAFNLDGKYDNVTRYIISRDLDKSLNCPPAGGWQPC